MKREIAVFDFDGTLTTKDTFLEVIKFAFGKPKFYLGFSLHLPWLLLMKLRLYPNWECKQKVFSWFFKGMPHERFLQICNEFSIYARAFLRHDTTMLAKRYVSTKANVYVISASVDEWVRPVCMSLGIRNVIGTKIEVDAEGLLTGRFLSKNCYGPEKVKRLLEVEPNRSEYVLHAFGDSRGDKEMLQFADEGTLV